MGCVNPLLLLLVRPLKGKRARYLLTRFTRAVILQRKLSQKSKCLKRVLKRGSLFFAAKSQTACILWKQETVFHSPSSVTMSPN